MTEQEAIIELSYDNTAYGGRCTEKVRKIAIKALEKQIPKKVEIEPWSPAHCPTCGHELSESQGDGFYKHYIHLGRCPNVECGQRLEW